MTELDFVKKYCNLTPDQEHMLMHCINNDTFIGIGSGIGRTAIMPLVTSGKTCNVIDSAGYYQLAGDTRRWGYEFYKNSGVPFLDKKQNL